MKVSNAYLFNRAVDQMGTVQQKLSKTQAQMSSGKQILAASDAPDQAATISRYKDLIAQQDSYQSSITSLNSRLQTESTALTSVNDLLVRMKELGLQASSDTLGSTDRQAIGTEMAGLRDQILSLANSQDSSGNYIFAGSRVNNPPFVGVNGQAPTYQGDQNRMQVPVGNERSVQVNRPGTVVFASVVRQDAKGQNTATGFFQSLSDMVNAVQNSDHTQMEQGLGELDKLQNGISLAQAQVGTDQNVLTNQQSLLDDTTLTLKNVLSGAEDLDYASAAATLSQQSLSLQAAQSSFAKIAQLSLFNYIN